MLKYCKLNPFHNSILNSSNNHVKVLCIWRGFFLKVTLTGFHQVITNYKVIISPFTDLRRTKKIKYYSTNLMNSEQSSPDELVQVCAVPLNTMTLPDSRSTTRFSAEKNTDFTIASDR